MKQNIILYNPFLRINLNGYSNTLMLLYLIALHLKISLALNKRYPALTALSGPAILSRQMTLPMLRI